MILKAGTDVKKIAKRLQKKGIVVKQQLADGSYVVYKKRRMDERTKGIIKANGRMDERHCKGEWTKGRMGERHYKGERTNGRKAL